MLYHSQAQLEEQQLKELQVAEAKSEAEQMFKAAQAAAQDQNASREAAVSIAKTEADQLFAMAATAAKDKAISSLGAVTNEANLIASRSVTLEPSFRQDQALGPASATTSSGNAVDVIEAKIIDPDTNYFLKAIDSLKQGTVSWTATKDAPSTPAAVDAIVMLLRGLDEVDSALQDPKVLPPLKQALEKQAGAVRETVASGFSALVAAGQRNALRAAVETVGIQTVATSVLGPTALNTNLSVELVESMASPVVEPAPNPSIKPSELVRKGVASLKEAMQADEAAKAGGGEASRMQAAMMYAKGLNLCLKALETPDSLQSGVATMLNEKIGTVRKRLASLTTALKKVDGAWLAKLQVRKHVVACVGEGA
eukprot:SAG31_NODE_2198_length_6212_cov_3.843096_2_plen_368_part_00